MYYRMCPAASRVKVSGTISRAQRYTQPRELGAVCVGPWDLRVCVCVTVVCVGADQRKGVFGCLAKHTGCSAASGLAVCMQCMQSLRWHTAKFHTVVWIGYIRDIKFALWTGPLSPSR